MDFSFVDGEGVLSILKKELVKCERIYFAIAFLKSSGLALIKESLVKHVRLKGRQNLEIIIGTSDFYITEPQALKSLIRIADVRGVNNKGFHPKIFCLEYKQKFILIVGSSNLSAPALGSGNIEANIVIKGMKNESTIYKETIDFFLSS